MTLFIRVLVPGFGREKSEEGGLDLEGGGLLRRLKRLVSGVLRKMKGSPASTEPKGERPWRAMAVRLCPGSRPPWLDAYGHRARG